MFNPVTTFRLRGMIITVVLGSFWSQPLFAAAAESDAPLPPDVTAVWDLEKAYRQTTSTRERICISAPRRGAVGGYRAAAGGAGE